MQRAEPHDSHVSVPRQDDEMAISPQECLGARLQRDPLHSIPAVWTIFQSLLHSRSDHGR